MANKSNEHTPLGNFLATIGFFAGLMIGWQNSKENILTALITGLVLAAVGAFVGNVIWRVVIIALAVALAIGGAYVRREVVKTVFTAATQNRQVDNKPQNVVLPVPARPKQTVREPDSREANPPASQQNSNKTEAGEPPPPASSAPSSEPRNNRDFEIVSKHTDQGPYRLPRGTAGRLFDPMKFDYFADLSEGSFFVYHAPVVDYDRFSHAEYRASTHVLLLVTQDGEKYDIGATINASGLREVLEEAQEISVIRTKNKVVMEGRRYRLYQQDD